MNILLTNEVKSKKDAKSFLKLNIYASFFKRIKNLILRFDNS